MKLQGRSAALLIYFYLRMALSFQPMKLIHFIR